MVKQIPMQDSSKQLLKNIQLMTLVSASGVRRREHAARMTIKARYALPVHTPVSWTYRVYAIP